MFECCVFQFYEFLAQYNRVSEMCFNHCVHDFTTRKVLDAEVRIRRYKVSEMGFNHCVHDFTTRKVLDAE